MKKADVSIETVVLVTVALIVIAVVVFIFYTQVKGSEKGFFNLREGAINSCKSVVDNNLCQENDPSTADKKYTIINSAEGKWSDCDTKCWKQK